MAFYCIILGIVSLLLLIIIFSRLNVMLKYEKSSGNNIITIKVTYMAGIVKYEHKFTLDDLFKERFTKKMPKTVKERFSKEKILNKLNEIKVKIKRFENIINYMKFRVLISEYSLKVHVGTGEAYYTGIFSGIAWSLAGIIQSLIENNFRVKKKHIEIKALFMEEKFNIELYCILNMRIVHIIFMLLKFSKTIGGDFVGGTSN